jgi:hypothetical protein
MRMTILLFSIVLTGCVTPVSKEELANNKTIDSYSGSTGSSMEFDLLQQQLVRDKKEECERTNEDDERYRIESLNSCIDSAKESANIDREGVDILYMCTDSAKNFAAFDRVNLTSDIMMGIKDESYTIETINKKEQDDIASCEKSSRFKNDGYVKERINKKEKEDISICEKKFGEHVKSQISCNIENKGV